MSCKINPQALTAAMLMERVSHRTLYLETHTRRAHVWRVATLATQLHRLALAVFRHALTENNGVANPRNRERVNQRMRKLSLELDAFALSLSLSGDGGLSGIHVTPTDPSRPVLGNGWVSGVWVILGKGA